MNQRNRWFDRIRSCILFKKTGLYSIKGRQLRIDLIQIWKAFRCDIDVGFSDIIKYPRNTRPRGHAYKLSIPLCRKQVKIRSFAVECVNRWNSNPAEAVASNNIETFKQQLDRFLTYYMKFHDALEKKSRTISRDATCIVSVYLNNL